MRAVRIGVAALLVAGFWYGVPAADAAGRSCQGKPATLVGKPSATTLKGTSGDDVIVTNGAFEVQARAGNDLICVTIAKGDPGPALSNIMAGSGNDTVTVTGHHDGVFVALGDGSDAYAGGSGDDTVWAGQYLRYDYETAADARDDDHDLIATGAGDDGVVVGEPDTATEDHVDLGPGDDYVTLMSTAMTPSARLDLGEGGYDGLGFDWLDDPTGTWLFDNSTGTGADDTGRSLAWSGVELFDLPTALIPPVSFRGGAGPEIVDGGVFDTVDLGPGDDELRLRESYLQDPLPAGHLEGGAGRDELMIDQLDRVRVDLVAGIASTRSSNAQDLSLSGIEDVSVYAYSHRRVTVIADDGPNQILVGGCRTQVEGGGGPDRITARESRCEQGGVILRGGSGPDDLRGGGTDRLFGGSGDDIIRGAGGHDHAHGGSGKDRCRAEARHSCALY